MRRAVRLCVMRLSTHQSGWHLRCSKFGMTMVTHGLGAEVEGTGITVNSLWPATAVESLATKNFGMGSERLVW